MAVKHFMMFGTFAEQRHFIYPSDNTYDGVIFNANMVAHAPAGLAAFLVTRTNKLRYLIDPLTHAFQHQPSVVYKNDQTTEVKKAIRRLAESYGSPVKEHVGVRSLVPSDFGNPDLVDEFATNVLAFQRDEVMKRAKDHDDCKYFSEAELSGFEPFALVAPYFYMSEYLKDEWLEVNLKLVASALDRKIETEKVFAEVVLDKALLSDMDWIKGLAEKYTALKPDGFLLWIDSFDEHQVSRSELKGFLTLCKQLTSAGTEVINLHGGYFSILAGGTLGGGVLTGVTHGPEFGEARAVVPVGGGLPFAKYYLPCLHERVKYRDMLAILSAKEWNVDADTFHANVCNCPACRAALNGDITNFQKYGESTVLERRQKNGIVRIDYPTPDARLLCLRHYLETKVKEYDQAMGARDDLLSDLDSKFQQLLPVLGYEGVKHLVNWKTVFHEFGSEA